jgi:hypothetical protein
MQILAFVACFQTLSRAAEFHFTAGRQRAAFEWPAEQGRLDPPARSLRAWELVLSAYSAPSGVPKVRHLDYGQKFHEEEARRASRPGVVKSRHSARRSPRYRGSTVPVHPAGAIAKTGGRRTRPAAIGGSVNRSPVGWCEAARRYPCTARPPVAGSCRRACRSRWRRSRKNSTTMPVRANQCRPERSGTSCCARSPSPSRLGRGPFAAGLGGRCATMTRPSSRPAAFNR